MKSVNFIINYLNIRYLDVDLVINIKCNKLYNVLLGDKHRHIYFKINIKYIIL